MSMSETDSENDYESADEDPDLANPSNAKPEQDSSCSFTTEKEPIKVVIEVETVAIAQEKTINKEVNFKSHMNQSAVECANIKLNKNEEKVQPIPIIVESLVTESNSSPKATPSPANDTNISELSSKPVADVSSDENSKAADKSQKPVISELLDKTPKPVISESSDNIPAVVIDQPKRVTLRLEKKIQQRNLQIETTEKPENETKPQQTSSWGFGSWGTSLISSAASSVSTFAGQVTQGIGTVLETVESSLGAPAPEDLAAILKEKRDSEAQSPQDGSSESSDKLKADEPICQIEEQSSDKDGSTSTAANIFTGVSSFTKVLENTSSRVLMGGLDTLELIGKKTIDILTEGDPGLRNKRSAFTKGTTTLSQILREAKQKADQQEENASMDERDENIYYSKLFDEFQGLVHLEALEMLSGQCQSKIHGVLLMERVGFERKDDLEKIKSICEDDLNTDDDDDDDVAQDFDAAIKSHLEILKLPVKLEKIKTIHQKIVDWLMECAAAQDRGEVKLAKDLYQKAIFSLAEFTARSVEQFHKFGELLLFENDSQFDAIGCATHLTGLTSVMCTEVHSIANKFCTCLNTAADDSEDPDAVTPLITNVYLEASNSAAYIQDAFQLLVPVLQSMLLP